MQKQLVAISDVARQLGVSVYTVRRLIDQGHVTAVNVGARRMIPAGEVDRIVRKGAGRPRKPRRGGSLGGTR